MRILGTRPFCRALIGMLGTGEMLVRSWHVVAFSAEEAALPKFKKARTAAALSQLSEDLLANALLEAGPTLVRVMADNLDMGEVWRAIYASFIEAAKKLDGDATPEQLEAVLQLGLYETLTRDGRSGIDLAETVNRTNPAPLYQRVFAWVTDHLTVPPPTGSLIKITLATDIKVEATELTTVQVDDELTEDAVVHAVLALVMTMDRNYIDPDIRLQGAAIEASRLRSGLVAQLAKVSNRIHHADALKLPFGLPSFEISAGLVMHPLMVKAAHEIVSKSGLTDAYEKMVDLINSLPQQCVEAMKAGLDPNGKEAEAAAMKVVRTSEREVRRIHGEMEKAAAHVGQTNQAVAENLMRAADQLGHLESVLDEFRKSTAMLKKEIKARLKQPGKKWPEGRTAVARAVTNIYTSRFDYI